MIRPEPQVVWPEELVDPMPMTQPPPKRLRGHTVFYPERLFAIANLANTTAMAFSNRFRPTVLASRGGRTWQ
jgi:hypothetical protein